MLGRPIVARFYGAELNTLTSKLNKGPVVILLYGINERLEAVVAEAVVYRFHL
jgi:hypothetical protein